MTKEEATEFIANLCREMYEEIFQFALGYCRDKHLAEEVVQEVFYEAWCHVEKLAVHENRRGWIYNTAKNKVKKLRGKKARLLEHEIPMEELIHKLSTEDTYDFLVLDEFSHMVNEEQMELLKSHYQNRNSYVEMAEDFGKSEGACKMAVSRIRSQIRSIMKISGNMEQENKDVREEK